jgi:mono/diheme cytochrome c family protein
MKTNAKPNRTLRLILLVVALGLICVAGWLAITGKKPWIIPVDEKARKNPLTASATVLNAARPVYDQKCSDCHGDTGKGDGSDAMMYDPPPANLTDAAHINKLTDGEIYYQITEGRKPMPSFKTKLTEEQRWQLVILVRAFANGTAPPATPGLEQKEPAPADAKKPTAPGSH